jgi:flagellin-specific chaperone FliS
MTPHDPYRETQILPATPQRLRLTLVEEAIRRARLTAELWREARDHQALESLIGCRAIVSELLAGVREGESPLAKQVVALYVFLFQLLTRAQVTRDVAALDTAIRVLEEERQTWSQLCLQYADAPVHGARSLEVEEVAASAGSFDGHSSSFTPTAASRFSLDA